MAKNNLHHHHSNGFLSSSDNLHNNFSSMGENNCRPSHQLLQPESTPYYPNLESYRSFTMNPNSYQDNVYDLPLELDFSRLSLSNPSHQYPFTTPPPSAYGNGSMINGGGGVINGGVGGVGGGSAIGNNPFLDSSIGNSGFSPILPFDQPPYGGNGDLRRMRVESAVRGQMGGFHMHQQQQPPLSYPGWTDDEGFDQNLGLHGFDSNSSINWSMGLNRCPSVARRPPLSTRNEFQPSYDPFVNGNGVANTLALARNGFRGVDNNRYTNGGPRINNNGFYGSENPRVLMSSLHNHNNNYIRSQPRMTYSSVNELIGKILLVSKDQHGCRFLQRKVEERKPEDIEMIFMEVKDYIRELSLDQFGNYLIQKLCENCNVDQITQILVRVISDDHLLLVISVDIHGTRVVQRLVENVSTAEQKNLMVSVLKRITVPLTKSLYGHHVIQHCLKYFTAEQNKPILNVIADNCMEISTDKSGCCVVQQCIAHALGEQKQRIVADITANAVMLTEHPYGNYVVQYLLGLKDPVITKDVMAQLGGNFTSLSMNKYASNVVQKCIVELEDDHSNAVIDELVNSPNFLMILQDPFGNYVAQSALEKAQGPLRDAMTNLIQIHHPFLHSHPHGKRVLARLRGGAGGGKQRH